ncbi:MAG: hypothetical protein GY940_33870, partial [bacterium]|nr:hypothetical protein [bacterium]
MIVLAIFFFSTSFLHGGRIHRLAKKGNVKALNNLLEKNPAVINNKDKSGWTALQLAAATGQVKAVKLLLEKGADVNTTDQFGFNALNLAALKGNNKIFEMLVEKGARVKSDQGSEEIFSKIFSANQIRDELVELLFHNQVDKRQVLNDLAKQKEGTASVMAQMSLEESWIDVTVQKGDGGIKIPGDALKQLRELGNKFVARRMNARAEAAIGNTELHTAVQKGDLKKVNALLKKYPRWLNKRNRFGITPLHYASVEGNLAIAQRLVAVGARVNAITKTGITPLYGAVSEEKTELVRFLISKGARVRAITLDGATALHVASTKEIARMLVRAGARVKEKNKFGFTPLHLAAHHGHVEVAGYLLSRRAHIESRTNTGWTPLCEADYGLRPKMVEFLASKGANVNTKT